LKFEFQTSNPVVGLSVECRGYLTFILFKTLHCLSIHRANRTGPTFSTLLRKIVGRFLILVQSLTISGEKH